MWELPVEKCDTTHDDWVSEETSANSEGYHFHEHGRSDEKGDGYGRNKYTCELEAGPLFRERGCWGEGALVLYQYMSPRLCGQLTSQISPIRQQYLLIHAWQVSSSSTSLPPSVSSSYHAELLECLQQHYPSHLQQMRQ